MKTNYCAASLKMTALSVALVLGFPAVGSAQFLPDYQTQNRAKGIGEMSDAQIAEALRTQGRVSMSGAFFETDSADLAASSDEVLFKLASSMKIHPELRLAVVGHTDSVGDFNYNLDLAERRANTVVEALQKDPYNITQERLVAVGVGSIDPIASNISEEGRALNRRVTFVVLGDSPF